MVLQKKGLIFVVSGPSGSGKTTLIRRLLSSRRLNYALAKSVSFTTRPKRSGEKEGQDYFFLSEKGFRQKLKAKKILEWTRYLGYYYATPKDLVDDYLNQGRYLILCLDVRGAWRIKRIYPKNTITIFILPPSLEALRKRITKRSSKAKAKELTLRLNLAKKESLAAKQYDHCLVNKNLPGAVKRLHRIIFHKIKQTE